MKLPAIDVLRGLAALGVVWFHSRVDLWVGLKEILKNPSSFSAFDRYLSWFSIPASLMGALVMLFFVLSGFCIHLPLARKAKSLNYVSYSLRRAIRIWPAYCVALIISYFCGQFILSSSTFVHQDIKQYATSLFFLQNWFYSCVQVFTNPSLWSIPVEVEFYIVYPVLWYIHSRFGIRGSIVFTLLCTLCGFVLYSLDTGMSSGTFFKYSVIWNSGAWLADRVANNTLPKWTIYHTVVIGVTFMCSICGEISGIPTFYMHYLWGVVSFLLLMYLIDSGKWIFPENAKFVQLLCRLGTISYSLYLIHFPLFKVAGFLWKAHFGSKPMNFLIPTLGTLLVIPFAAMFYILIEKPSHKLARRLSDPR